ncbi:MAG: hypothetical protein K6E50_11975 [Lachnospiraceae bacterium]|nr:hypothetical protein [Lachnospiraceae bacterium]
MLTISAPIELKTSAFRMENNGFAERIRANYAVIGSNVSEQSLTHMLHTPPQLLVAEGGESYTGISNSITSVTQLQQTLISNVVNRILLSNEMTLSYQDRVYISTMLHKLGIRDERRFMNESRRILSETKNSTELTKFYMESMPLLKQMMLRFQENRVESAEDAETAGEAGTENRLYMSIMRRLQTGAIYQIIQNMTYGREGDSLNSTEISLSEQSYTARQLLLTQFREMAAGKAVPMIYRSENVYEEETRDVEESGEERIRERINSALLLEVLRSFDHAQSLRIEREKKRWTDLRESFYRSADHSLSRILLTAREGRSPLYLEENTLQFLTETEERELGTLREILRDREKVFYPEETIVPAFRESVMTDRSSETLEEMYERINEQNVQNVDRYMEIRRILTQRSEGERRISDRERTIRESIRTLNDREHLMELLEKEDVSQPSAMERTLEKVYSLLPPETVAILRQADAQTAPAQAQSILPGSEEELIFREEATEEPQRPEAGMVRERTAEVLLDERLTETLSVYERLITRELRERERSLEEKEHMERTILEPAETVLLLQRLTQTQRTEEAGTESIQYRDRRSSVQQMIHRSIEQLSEEDILETLEEFRRNESRKTEVHEEESRVSEIYRQEPVRISENMQPADSRKQSEEIARMVEQGVRKQLGLISNEVYNRLERRLKTEKARRGI